LTEGRAKKGSQSQNAMERTGVPAKENGLDRSTEGKGIVLLKKKDRKALRPGREGGFRRTHLSRGRGGYEKLMRTGGQNVTAERPSLRKNREHIR